jgi:hypothetical protein
MEYSEDIAKQMRQAWFDAFDTVNHLDSKRSKFAHIQQTVMLVKELIYLELTLHEVDEQVLKDMSRVIDNHVGVLAKEYRQAMDDAIKLREFYEAYKESQTTGV